MSKTSNLIRQCILAISCFGFAVASLPASSSPSAHNGLICLTDNPADCYPRIFEPTKDFQVIRDGQDLPPGLHVRMNIYTGGKEARLNIPMEEDEVAPEVITEQAIVVIPETESEQEEHEESSALRDRVPQKPPVYEAVGKIQPPRESDEGAGDSQIFLRATNTILIWSQAGNDAETEVTGVEAALVDLSDLAHDIYYGVELAKKPDLIHNLMEILTVHATNNPATTERRRLAASILGGAIQNNPTALQELEKSWSSLPSTSNMGAKGNQNLTESMLNGLRSEHDSGVMKARIYAISGLMKDAVIRDQFISSGGTETLFSIFIREGAQWDGVRVRIAQLMMDTFLDEGMGAELGVWPKGPVAEKKECESSVDDGCWEHHLNKETFGKGFDNDLKLEFLRLLKEGRSRIGDYVESSNKEL